MCGNETIFRRCIFLKLFHIILNICVLTSSPLERFRVLPSFVLGEFLFFALTLVTLGESVDSYLIHCLL